MKLSFFNVSLTIFTGCLIALSGAKAEEEKIRATTAPAKKPGFVLPTEKKSLEFEFGDIKAVIKEDGFAAVEGPIKHNRLRCATYQIGLQLGQGEYACTNVKWLTEPVYITLKKHCNSALLPHQGNKNIPGFQKVFPDVTCAKRLIRCTGVCD